MTAYNILQATLRLLQRSDDPTFSLFPSDAQQYASTIHSYQTLLSSVCLHMVTSSSEWMVEAYCWAGEGKRLKVASSELCSSRSVACKMQ